jgi:hypothetical protein
VSFPVEYCNTDKLDSLEASTAALNKATTILESVNSYLAAYATQDIY